MVDKTYISNSYEETKEIAKQFAISLNKGDFVALYGDLGAGKTAFTSGLASVISPDDSVCSPTYTIVNEYTSGKIKLCHFDMYRICDYDDLYSIGFFDYDDCIIVTEWSENIPYALPEHYYKVEIFKDAEDENKRTISIEEVGR